MAAFNFRTDLNLKRAIDEKARQGDIGRILSLGFEQWVGGNLPVPEDGTSEVMKEQVFARGIDESAFIQARARAHHEGISLSHVARHILWLWVNNLWTVRLVRNETQ